MTRLVDIARPADLPRTTDDKMQRVIVAFDVDGTLIRNTDPENRVHGLISTTDEPIDRQITLLKTLSTYKNVRIVVWSGGGKHYAESWGSRLGLDKYVWRYASKTQAKDLHEMCAFLIAIDDIQATALGNVNLIVREK